MGTPARPGHTGRSDRERRHRDVLHEQFLLIIQEYRVKNGMPPVTDWFDPSTRKCSDRSANSGEASSGNLLAQQTGLEEDSKLRSEAEETRAGGSAAEQAQEMLDAFGSVGALRFDLTLTNTVGGKIAFRGDQSIGQLRDALPSILAKAQQQQHNVIIRPRGPTIQLDDLDQVAIDRLRPVSFLILRTSPGNYQAWVAVADADEAFVRRLRQGTGADLNASGATRISGSMNFKEKHAPTFPRVETVHADRSRMVTRAELEALGVVAPAEMVTPIAIRSNRTETRGWPSYQRCVDGAPEASEGGRPDISRADFTFCLLAIDWGWSVEETADRLMQESGKAQAEGVRYAQRTARAAARAVERRGR